MVYQGQGGSVKDRQIIRMYDQPWPALVRLILERDGGPAGDVLDGFITAYQRSSVGGSTTLK